MDGRRVLKSARDQTLNGIRIGHIGLDSERAAARGSNLINGCLRGFHENIRGRYQGSLFRKLQRAGAADAGPGSGDDNQTVFEIHDVTRGPAEA